MLFVRSMEQMAMSIPSLVDSRLSDCCNEFLIPLFKSFKNLDNQTEIFLFDKFGATSEMDLFDSYFKYLNKVIVQYNQIETPKWYSYKNVATMGNSRLGRFIIFSLNTPNKIVRCYYIKDFNSLSKYWSNYFKEINKLENNKWYWDQIEIN